MNKLSVQFIFVLTLWASTECAKVDYHVWYEHDAVNGDRFVKEVHFSEQNETFFIQIMDKAAINDANYEYTYIQYSFGKYITSIGGRWEVPEENLHWSIYELTDPADENNPPNDDQVTPVGVSDLVVHDKGIYLFWRRQWKAETLKALPKSTIKL